MARFCYGNLKSLGRKIINPSCGYPLDIHRKTTGYPQDLMLIGHKPEEIRWISDGYLVDIHRGYL